VVEKDDPSPYHITIKTRDSWGNEKKDFLFILNVFNHERVKDLKKKISKQCKVPYKKWRPCCDCNVCRCSILYNDEMLLADILVWGGEVVIIIEDAIDEIEFSLHFINFGKDELSSLELDSNNSIYLRLLPCDGIRCIFNYIFFYTRINEERIKLSKNGDMIKGYYSLSSYGVCNGCVVDCELVK
jgi:hypothetical protein